MGLFFRKRRGEGSATPNPSALPTAPAPVSSPPTTSPTAQPAAPAADASLADAIIDSIDDGLMVVDANGTIKIFNPKAAEISGFSANEALNLNFISIFKLADAAENAVLNENNPIMNTIKNRTPLKSDDFMLTQKSGTRINLELRISLINFGGATGAAVLFRDITARKAADAEKADFISTASHEMRTPVTAIQGYLGLLANPKTATLDDKARDYVTKAAAEATHLGNLFQDLLDTTKADDGRIIFHLQPLNTASLAATAVQDLAAKAASKNLTLAMAETKGLQPIFLVSADPDRLLEVLHNLIDNAIKYTNSGGITVAVTGDESMVAISVRDTGIGIAPDDAPHIFQKFYRIDNSDTRTVGGTGLGLYLTAQLVEKMRGEIRVESEPGKGSNFIVTMPRLSEADAKLASTGMALTPKAPGTVEGS